MNENHQSMIDYYKNNPDVSVVKEMMTHPKDKIKRSRQYIENIMDYGVALDENKISYVKHGNRNNPDALLAIDKEVEWIKRKLK